MARRPLRIHCVYSTPDGRLAMTHPRRPLVLRAGAGGTVLCRLDAPHVEYATSTDALTSLLAGDDAAVLRARGARRGGLVSVACALSREQAARMLGRAKLLESSH